MRPVAICALATAVACQTGDESRSAEAAGRALALTEVLSAEVDAVGTIESVQVGSDGALWFSDPANSQLVRFDPETRSLDRLGRSGDGPGELRTPDGLSVGADDVVVYDVRMGRVTRFGHAGEFRAVVSTPGPLLNPVVVNRSGDVLAQTMGYGPGLATLVRTDGSRRAVGELVVRASGQPIPRLQAEAQRMRQVPQDYRNLALPVLADDGHAWLVLSVEGEVRSYTPEGELAWSARLPATAVETARASYLQRIAENPDRLWLPQVASDAQLAAGQLWIALPELVPGDSAVVVLDAASGVQMRLFRLGHLGFIRVAPDPERNRLYIVQPQEGRILAASLPHT